MGGNPFQQLQEKQKEKKKDTDNEDDVKYSEAEMLDWINEKQNSTGSNICALLVGHQKTGKTGVLLDSRTDDEIKAHKKVVVFELNSDKGCEVNKVEHHNDDPDIIILNPREYKIENGEWQPDYIATMAKIKSSIQAIKNNVNSLNIKVLGFDGLDIFLSEICESQMRIDEHIDVSGGVSMRYWKKRNKYYYDVLNMIFDIDGIDKYFITHYGDRRRDDKTGQFNDERTVSAINSNLVYSCQKSTADKMHQIVEFSDKTRIVEGSPKRKLTATIISDRRDLAKHMEEIVIAEVDGKKTIWNGRTILRMTKT